jgi:hypothetical protein
MIDRRWTLLLLCSLGACCKQKQADKADLIACESKSTRPVVTYVDNVPFTWTETPSLASAPAGRAVASVGGRTFELPVLQLWVKKDGSEYNLISGGGKQILGPSIYFPGKPEAGKEASLKWGDNSGYFQIPRQGTTVECFEQSVSFNGSNAGAIKFTKYDGKTASGTFVTTWRRQGASGEQRFWAAGTFLDIKVYFSE